MKTTTLALAAAMAAGTLAHAQEAVQWRVEDGGNGHWYRGVSTSNIVDLAQATTIANAVGGYPVTITSPGESQLITTLSDNDTLWASYWAGPVIGLHVDDADCLPGCWVSGERFDYSNWHPGNPDSPATDNCVILFQRNMRRWQNYPCDYGFQGTLPHSVIVEWSADCNGDGIVDYGQILDGTLEDVNANGVPDCCEAGFDCGANLVANGGFEQGPEQADCTWVKYSAGSTAIPSWIVTAGDIDRVRRGASCPANESWLAIEGEYTIDLVGFVPGEIQQVISTVPGTTYRLSFQLTINGGVGSTEQVAVSADAVAQTFAVSGQPGWPQPWSLKSLDFIASDESTTITFKSLTPAPGGPVIDDVRVSPYLILCSADINDDGTVNGADISVLLGYWGQSGKNVVGDITGDGIVNGADLALLLGNWGPCQ